MNSAVPSEATGLKLKENSPADLHRSKKPSEASQHLILELGLSEISVKLDTVT